MVRTLYISTRCSTRGSSGGFREQHTRVTNISRRSKASSRASAVSAVSLISVSIRAKATAKITKLEAQAAALRKRRALQEEQFRLQQVAEELELVTELAMVTAEQRAYFEAEKNEIGINRCRQEDCRKTAISSLQNKREISRIQPPQQAINSLVTHIRQKASEPKSTIETRPTEIEPNTALSTATENEKIIKCDEAKVCSTPNQRNNDDDALERFILNANALMLPRPEVPVFDGDPIEYQTFVRAFENLMEANTDSDSARLYYLIQYVRGYVRELMKSCLSMKNEEGYLEARRLLKQKYGQNYKNATASIERVTNGPSIKSEDGATPSEILHSFNQFAKIH